MKRLRTIAAAIALLVAAVAVALQLTNWSAPVIALFTGKKTIEQRLSQYGPAARTRLRPSFESAGVAYPPPHVTLLAVKAEKRLDVYAPDARRDMRLVKSYPILAASGRSGPKLRAGDLQVPEGVYAIESLNPNSRFHLSLRLNYPNDFDRAMAAGDGRGDLGGDIMIHGKRASVGCLAMGDEAAEDLFVLAADCGLEGVRVVIVPTDFRAAQVQRAAHGGPAWLPGLYDQLRAELAALPVDAAAADAR